MQLLIYLPPFHSADRYLGFLADGWEKRHPCRRFGTLPALAAFVRRPLGIPVVCILAPMNGRELSQLNAMGYLLRDMRIVLILPDDRPETISDGHALRPRFVSYADGDLSDVHAVVDKILEAEAFGPLRATG